jgi:hypothetical protein
MRPQIHLNSGARLPSWALYGFMTNLHLLFRRAAMVATVDAAERVKILNAEAAWRSPVTNMIPHSYELNTRSNNWSLCQTFLEVLSNVKRN